MGKEILIPGKVPAYYSYPDVGGRCSAVLLIHEAWGLVDHIKAVADRFCAAGYAVLAPDLFHGMDFVGKIDQTILDEVANPATRDEAQKKLREVLAPIRSPEFSGAALEKLRLCVDYLMHDSRINGEVAVTGFCFGGTFTYALAVSDPRLKAAIPFYGRPPEPLDQVAEIQCPILAFYGEKDTALTETLPLLVNAMHRNGKTFEPVVYPKTGHAFFNDTNARLYNKDAAIDAWEKSLTFLRKYLKP